MQAEAIAFLQSLTPEQRGRAVFPFDSHERLDWHYVPRARKGIALAETDAAQRAAAHALLRAGLSEAGYRKATDIMRLEAVLRAIETVRRHYRDPDNYAFTVFGDPEAGPPWGWRVEGHHLSLNFTFAPTPPPSVTPAFFGANPARVPAPHELAGLRVLAAEEDLARALVRGLTPAARGKAVIAARSLGDIVSGPGRAETFGEPVGLRLGDMAPAQRGLAERLVDEYVRTMRTELAEAHRARIREAGLADVHFAWAGGTEPGEAHYYRLHGPRLLIEYDNTQNDANHVHSVWRDPTSDFALDLLGDHYRDDPHAGRNTSLRNPSIV
jgi:hypothetical protein